MRKGSRAATTCTSTTSSSSTRPAAGAVGEGLLAFAEEHARMHGLGAVFLDSRPEVVAFYAARGYEPHTATLMRKRVG